MAEPHHGRAIQFSPVIAVIVDAANESCGSHHPVDVCIDEIGGGTVPALTKRRLDEPDVSGENLERLGHWQRGQRRRLWHLP